MQPSAENVTRENVTRYRCEHAIHGSYHPDKECAYRLPHTHQDNTPTRLRCNNTEHGVVQHINCVPMPLNAVKEWYEGNAHRTWPTVAAVKLWLERLCHPSK